MPSFQDSAVLVLLALLLFGPKGLAKLAREIGKLMGEFRRASSEFRLQMEDEFRISEQADQQKKIAAIEAAAPVTPAFPAEPIPEPEHPHLHPEDITPHAEPLAESNPSYEAPSLPEPIASAGELRMMPPSTGLPASRSFSPPSLSGIFDSIPQVPAPEHPESAAPEHAAPEQATPEHAQEETTHA
jgi:sec-independent protein translocase protein TatB